MSTALSAPGEGEVTRSQYLRACSMDVQIGTFMSRDPLAALPAWLGNAFGNAGANPAKAADPTGMLIEERTDDWGTYWFDTDTNSKWDDGLRGVGRSQRIRLQKRGLACARDAELHANGLGVARFSDGTEPGINRPIGLSADR